MFASKNLTKPLIHKTHYLAIIGYLSIYMSVHITFENIYISLNKKIGEILKFMYLIISQTEENAFFFYRNRNQFKIKIIQL